jgi:nucleoid-associated protein YgaU
LAEFRKREDINQELELLQTWSELGAPKLEDLSRPLSSLVRTVDPRLMDDMTPSTIDVRVSEAPPEFADLPPGDEERPRQGGLLILLAIALLATAAALFLASRWDSLVPRQAPTETPSGDTGGEDPDGLGIPVPTATPVPSPSPSVLASASPAPSPTVAPSPTAVPSARPSVAASAVVPAQVPGGETPRPDPTPASPTSASPAASVPSHVPTLTPSLAPTPTADAPSTVVPAPAQRDYVVRAGDSLSAIAAAELGDEARWTEIYALNRDVVSHPDVIRPQTRLQLPGAGPAAAPRAASYRVRPGDTLSGIAASQLGDEGRWRELYDLNRDRVAAPSLIRPGMTLRLPGAGAGGVRPIHRRAAVGAPATTIHAVQAGESLSLLARRYLGSAQRWPEIYYLNSHKIANPQWIYPGQRLAIPAGGPQAEARYMVRSGDTLWTIARREMGDGAAWPAIYQANRARIADPHWIYPGQSLTVPR